MNRNADSVMFSADRWAEIGKDLGFSKDVLSDAVAKAFALSNYHSPVVNHPDPRVRHILSRLKERGLPVPQEFPAISENPDLQKFVALVYVDPAISIADLIAVIEVSGKKLTNDLDLSKIKDVVETPKKPYFFCMQDGRLYKGKSPDQAVALFTSNERGATVREGLFLILYYPKILNDHYIDLPGSRYVGVNVPYLHVWNDAPELGAYFSVVANSSYGSASCGSIS